MDNAIVLRNDTLFVAPVIDVDQALIAYQGMKDFVENALRADVDFGIIPGTAKATLLKPGAEKLTKFFGLSPRFEIVQSELDWTGANHGGEPFFYFHYRCAVSRDGRLVAEAEGSANSWEKKHRYRWVNEQDVPPHLDKSKLRTRGGKISEFGFAIDKAETSGKYGKPAEYWKSFQDAIANGTAKQFKKKTSKGGEFDAWEIDGYQYCIPNEDSADLVNTLQKMGQKRAFVAAVLIAVNGSEYFTQDMEDFDFVEGDYHIETVATNSPAPVVKSTPAPTNGGGKPPAPEPVTQAEQASPRASSKTLKAWTDLRNQAIAMGIDVEIIPGDITEDELRAKGKALRAAVEEAQFLKAERDADAMREAENE